MCQLAGEHFSMESQLTVGSILAACKGYALDDEGLAQLLSRVARHAAQFVSDLPEAALDSSEKRALMMVFEDIFPEIAHRLLAQKNLALMAGRAADMRSLPDDALRRAFEDTICSIPFKKLQAIALRRPHQGETHDIDLATASIVNGNIAAIAMNRIHAPREDDFSSILTRIAAEVRGVPGSNGTWNPDFARRQLDPRIVEKVEPCIRDLMMGHTVGDSFSAVDELTEV